MTDDRQSAAGECAECDGVFRVCSLFAIAKHRFPRMAYREDSASSIRWKFPVCALRFLCLLACGVSASASASSVPLGAVDPHSYAQPDRARVTHLALDLTVDFDKQRR
jgi:hypothetical protein